MTAIDIDRFSQAKILVVGDLMLDRYWWGTVDRISPEAPVPIVQLNGTSVKAGGAANVAANIAGLGAKATLLGVTGEDTEAEELASVLDGEPLIVKRFEAVAGRSTTVKTRIIAHDQHVVRLDREEKNPVPENNVANIASSIKELIPEMDVVVVSDYAKGLLSPDLLAFIVDVAREHGAPIFADPKGKDFTKYRGVSMITPNLLEAANACGIEHNDPGLVSKAGSQLLRDLDAENVLITEGANGMTLFGRTDRSTHFDAVARTVYDVTGAGDTVIATLAVAAAAGLELEDAAMIANIAAGIAVGRVGTAVISQAELAEAYAAAGSSGKRAQQI